MTVSLQMQFDDMSFDGTGKLKFFGSPGMNILHKDIVMVKYSPARDVMYITLGVARQLHKCMITEGFPYLNKLLADANVTEEEIAKGISCFESFLTLSASPSCHNMRQAWDTVGWSEVRPEVRFAVFYYVGLLSSGTFFAGLKDSLIEGDKPLEMLHTYVADAEKLWVYAHLSGWKRWLYRLLRWLRFAVTP